MNKKAATISGWVEVAVLMLIAFGGVVAMFAAMNAFYNDNKDPYMGSSIGTSVNNLTTSLTGYQDSYQQALADGEASFTSIIGLTLSTSYDVVKASISLVWGIVGGGWISQAALWIGLPDSTAMLLQILYLISGGLILIAILFKTARP